MRTTVTLDPDTASAVRQLMTERGVSFKQALNDAIRAGLQPRRAPTPFRTVVRHMGVPAVNLDRALQIAGELEDDEIAIAHRGEVVTYDTDFDRFDVRWHRPESLLK